MGIVDALLSRANDKLQQSIDRACMRDALCGHKGCAYPTHLVYVDTPQFHLLELVGTTLCAGKLSPIRTKSLSVEAYIAGIDRHPAAEGLLHCRGGSLEVVGTTLLTNDFAGELMARIQRRQRPTFKSGALGIELPFSVDQDFEDLTVRDCAWGGNIQGTPLLRYTQWVFIINNKLPTSEALSRLDQALGRKAELSIKVPLDDYFDDTWTRSLIFSNVYLNRAIKETQIANIINSSDRLVCNALGVVMAVSEATIRLSSERTVGLRPDLLLFDDAKLIGVADYKLAQLSTAPFVGSDSRRRLCAYLYDGAAQLATYRDWLLSKDGRSRIRDVFDCEVSDTLRTILIAGWHGNIKQDDVVRARSLHSNLELYDYSTLTTLGTLHWYN